MNCLDTGSLAAGSSAATKLTRFFDKVVERQFYTRDRSRSSSVAPYVQERKRIEKTPFGADQRVFLG